MQPDPHETIQRFRRLDELYELTVAMRREALRSQRYKDPLSAIMIDVDHFKQINDKRGHAAGDLVLAGVGSLLPQALRSCDVVARWGGEEFVIALPSTPLAGAAEVAERVRSRLEAALIHDPRGDRVPITASLGVAQLCEVESIEQLIDRADRAMYAAKSAGRNRVVSTANAADALVQVAGAAKPAEA